MESVGFEPLTQSGPIFYIKIPILKSNFDQEAVEGRGQTQCLEFLIAFAIWANNPGERKK